MYNKINKTHLEINQRRNTKMSKKQMIKQMLALVRNGKIYEPKENELINGLKDVAKQVLTVNDYEEVFSVKLNER